MFNPIKFKKMGNIDIFDLEKMMLKNGIEGAILKHLCNGNYNINSTRDAINAALRLKDSLSFKWDIESTYNHCGVRLSFSERDKLASEAIDGFIGKLNNRDNKKESSLAFAHEMLDQIFK